MGKVYIDSTEVGTFSPQEVGAGGVVKMDTTEVGTFSFTAPTGVVNLNATLVGTYSGLSYEEEEEVGIWQPTMFQPTIWQPSSII